MQGARNYLKNDDWRTLSKRIRQFKNGKFKDCHNGEAWVETFGSAGNNVAVKQIRHTGWFKGMCEKIGINKWPEQVQSVSGKLASAAVGEFAWCIEKAAYNWWFTPKP